MHRLVVCLRFGEFRLVFWNKLLRRVDLEPYQCTEAQHQRHQDQWPIITAGDLRHIAEHDPGEKGTYLPGHVHGATHRSRKFPRNINTNWESHRLIEAYSRETEAQKQKCAYFGWSERSEQGEETTASKTNDSNPTTCRL